MSIRHNKCIIVALDMTDLRALFRLVDQLDARECRLKVGKELFTLYGPTLVRRLSERGFDIFLDLKFHDIPNTVARAVVAAAELGVWMVSVHASGGVRMLEAAQEALENAGGGVTQLIAVTVLTSLAAQDLPLVGVADTPLQQVERLALLAKSCGLNGVVCSAQEASRLRKLCGSPFSLVTPGIRQQGSADDDQRRMMTPAEAMAVGADYLVIGRPITQSSEPLLALQTIQQSLGPVVTKKILIPLPHENIIDTYLPQT